MGFGDLNTEFWIGNDILHMVTNQKRYEMLIEMNDYENGSFYAMYRQVRFLTRYHKINITSQGYTRKII